jgi:hypothetical protein
LAFHPQQVLAAATLRVDQSGQFAYHAGHRLVPQQLIQRCERDALARAEMRISATPVGEAVKVITGSICCLKSSENRMERVMHSPSMAVSMPAARTASREACVSRL